MDDYSDRNRTLSMALRELLSELDYNTDMHEAEARGKTENTRELVMKIFKKGKSAEEIADLFDLDINYVQKILAANN